MMAAMESHYSEIIVELKTGQERFTNNGKDLGFDLLRFWQWSGSDLVGNTARGILAEYIVANALGIAERKTRIEWDAFDLLTASQIRVEVKSSSYLQSWYQRGLSKPIFGIKPTRKWNPVTNQMEGELKRQADVYVFCLLAHQTQSSLNPLNIEQWQFYLLPTAVLDEYCNTQKSIGLGRIISLGAISVKFDEIADRIDEIGLPKH